MQTTDIAIIGAGPAGATLARELSRSGREVLLVEKEPLPRHKPCGGGVPARTRAILDFDISDAVATELSAVALDGAWRGRITRAARGTCVVNRALFDHFLVKKAVASGAALMQDCAVKTVSRTGDGFMLETSKGEIRARILCACDGVFSRTARALGFAPNGLGFCFEGSVPMPQGLDPERETTAIFNLACLKTGYAWSFPRGKEWAIGIGGVGIPAGKLKRELAAFCRKTPELAGRFPERLYGGMLPDYTGPRPTYAEDGAYLVGDAAGLVDALTGEGIFYAIRSAQHAAQAIVSSASPSSAKPEAEYGRLLSAELLPELNLSLRAARHFRKIPGWLFGGLMSLPAFSRQADLFVQLLDGHITYRQLIDKIRGR